MIIGKGGENIQRMQMQTGAHIQIAKESEMKPGDTLRLITLKGSTEGILDLKRRIDEIILVATTPKTSTSQQGFIQPSIDTAFVLKIAVPNDKVGIIIGKQGMTIKGIQERSRAKVLIPAGYALRKS